ncbi:MAG: SGNH/GDSL hydrolase family protein [Chitinophagaceae bacterium]|nr:SGNH/GDSL hydrolase family protein [Chitinophagaceae bacterium]
MNRNKRYMKYLFLIVMSIASFGFQQPKKTKVIFFGDSITQMGVDKGGYITLIDSISKVEGQGERFEWMGAGIGGNKVYDLYLRLQKDVLDKKPDVVVIFIGVNDVWHKSSFGTGTDPDKFEKFYQAIIDQIKATGARIILCTPAVIGERTDFSNPQDGDLNAYSTIIRRIATNNQLSLVDLRKAFLDHNLTHNKENKDRGILTYDRVHLNAKGNLLVAREMWSKLKAIN